MGEGLWVCALFHNARIFSVLIASLACSDLNLEFEIPFRELGFHGVPARSTSFIMPTVNCLVELTEMPFTVIPLGGTSRIYIQVMCLFVH